MEAAPPSYQTATLTSVWHIVSRYMPSNDLCSAALVCSRWHNIFTPHIWGNPASHFGLEDDAVYMALVRFKRTLQTARLFVRLLTHTLHLPPAHPELYNGPHAEWLRDILEWLPNLQSLIVRGLPFFDHASLQALKYMRSPRDNQPEPPAGVLELAGSSVIPSQRPLHAIPSFSLRLLDASRCPNVTSHGLASALRRFDGLLYLDLSFTLAARDPIVLKTMTLFSGLQVLKMRGISLRDEGVRLLAQAIGPKVRSLDVRDNLITDQGAQYLLEMSFARTSSDSGLEGGLATGQRSPALLPYIGTEMLGIYQGEDFESFLRQAFTGRFVSRLAIEDAPPSGITHLYIAKNAITFEGVSGLVKSERLHVLDVGSLGRDLERHPSLSMEASVPPIGVPGLEMLTPILSKHAAESMTFLRINHSVITREIRGQRPEEVVPNRVELDTTHRLDAVEIDGTSVSPEAFELSAVPDAPRYELPGDAMHFFVSPAVNDAPKDIGDEANIEVKRDGAFAPEVVNPPTNGMAAVGLVNPMFPHASTALNSNLPTAVSPFTPTWPEAVNGQSRRPRSYSSTATERKARINFHTARGRNLHPAMLPHVKTLILTDVPPSYHSGELADRLIAFIQNCAQEAFLAHSLAKLDYSIPPGRKGHASALKQSADKVFALQKLVLELGPETETRRSSKASTWRHAGTKSMTGDQDSEALWAASDTDFSFFGDEECGVPTYDPDRTPPYAGAEAMEVPTTALPAVCRDGLPGKPRIETISRLSAFRKERRLAHQRDVAAGNPEAETEGFWEGLVQVVRPLDDQRLDEDPDHYGNKFTGSGW